MNHAAIVSAALLVLLAGCGGPAAPDRQSTDANGGTPTGSSTSATPLPSPTESEYAALSGTALSDALLGINDLPPGYSQDPPSKAGPDKTFCDYKPPFTARIKTSRDFTKGGGISSQVLSLGLRQYQNANQAEAAFEELSKTLETCRSETYDGSKLTYAVMSAPKVGDGAVGVRITSDGSTVLQNFALVGPTLVSAGAGGLMDVNADEVAGVLKDQVAAYDDAAIN